MGEDEREQATTPMGQRPLLPGNVPTPEFPFRIIAKAGEGSMGTVYRALEPALEREVAIKVLRADALAAFWDRQEHHEAHLRFLQEARSAAAIKHSGAVTVYRIGELADTPYIVMEWLDGETLSQRLAREGHLDLNVALDIALQVLDVLQVAHETGVVHRDIKPANLLLLPNGKVKVTDFGIAQFRQANLVETQAGVVLGTPFYASPEQLRGEVVDPRSDVYSVAVILFEMLAGERPFSGKTFQEFVTNVLRGAPRSLRELRGEVAPELAAIIQRGLAREREARWPSARALADALRAAAPLVPVAADPFPLEPLEASGTIRVARQSRYPVVRAATGGVVGAVCQFVRSWPLRELGEQPVEPLLRKLLDRPLHAAPFSGGLGLGEDLLLVHEGAVVAVLGGESRERRPAAVASLRRVALARLYSLPAEFPPVVVAELAALARGLETTQVGMDLPIVDPQALAARLHDRTFTGGLSLRSGNDHSMILYAGGKPVLALAIGPWEGVPVEATWSSWVATTPVSVGLHTLEVPPHPLTYAVRLRDAELVCRREGGSSGSLAASSPTTRRLHRLASRVSADKGQLVLEPRVAGDVHAKELLADPATAFLRWLLETAPQVFATGNLRTRWKYLAEWIPLVRQARLHHHPDRHDAALQQLFDLVTFDENEKLLHLAVLRDELSADDLAGILEEATAVKKNRLERGDVGALIVVAPDFSQQVIETYLTAIEATSRGLSRLQESVTGYAGFVRLGRGRGFHVLLVEARGGTYDPLLE